MAFEWNIVHPSKHVSLIYTFTKIGENWSAATFKLTVADTQGAAALITLNNVAAGSQGVSATYDAGYIHPTSGKVVGATSIIVQIDEATLEALTFPTAPAPKVMAYDLLVTPSGSHQRTHAWGALTVNPGVGD